MVIYRCVLKYLYVPSLGSDYNLCIIYVNDMQEGQRKYEEGMSALMEAQRLESEEGKRIDTINHQLNLLKMKEKEITEVRLCRSKLWLNYKIYAIWCTKHMYSL